MVPSVGVDALEVFQEELNLVLIKPADTQPFGEGFLTSLPTSCYAFSKKEKGLVSAADSKPVDTSGGGRGGVEVVKMVVMMMGVVVLVGF